MATGSQSRRAQGAVLLLLLATGASEVLGQALSLDTLPRGAPYSQIRAWHLQALSGNPSRSQRLDLMRGVIRAGPLGQRGLDQVFKNFEGAHSIDPTIPGVEKAARLSASSNSNVAKGYRRALLYAVQAHNDRRFHLVAMEQMEYGRGGSILTDKDIVLKHSPSGLSVRIEVKEVTPAAQRANVAKYKVQIDKMAAAGKRTGQMQVYTNRNEVIPELRQYAERRGVIVFERVSAGRAGERPGNMRMQDVLSKVDSHGKVIARSNAVMAGAQVGFGAAMMYQSFPGLRRELLVSLDPTACTVGSVLRTGRHASVFAGGAGLVVSGAGRAAMVLSEGAAVSRWIAGAAKAGPYVAVAMLVMSEAFLVAEWQAGEMTDRQFASAQASLAGSIGGGLAGAWLGAKALGSAGAAIGFAVGGPPGLAIGGVIGVGVGGVAGGFGGSYAGNYLANAATSVYYAIGDEERSREADRRVLEALQARYATLGP